MDNRLVEIFLGALVGGCGVALLLLAPVLIYLGWIMATGQVKNH